MLQSQNSIWEYLCKVDVTLEIVHCSGIFRFIFRFRPKKSCFLFFVYFQAEKYFLLLVVFTFSAENGKIIFGRPLYGATTLPVVRTTHG